MEDIAYAYVSTVYHVLALTVCMSNTMCRTKVVCLLPAEFDCGIGTVGSVFVAIAFQRENGNDLYKI